MVGAGIAGLIAGYEREIPSQRLRIGSGMREERGWGVKGMGRLKRGVGRGSIALAKYLVVR